jgi:hypothetical protein
MVEEYQSLQRRFKNPENKAVGREWTASSNQVACCGIEPCADRDDDVNCHQQNSLKPMTLAVLDEVVDQEDSDEEYCDLEAVEVKSHGVFSKTAPADDNHERKHEESDLHA